MTTRQFAAVFTAVFVPLALFISGARGASASTLSPGARMLAWAKANATGHWYAWGGTGLATYDCSGLVYRSALQTGVSGMARTTYGMLGSRLLVRTYHPVAGDLAFYGTGHVEIVDRGYDVTFGAQQTGTQVGDHHWSGWWRPTLYMHVL